MYHMKKIKVSVPNCIFRSARISLSHDVTGYKVTHSFMVSQTGSTIISLETEVSFKEPSLHSSYFTPRPHLTFITHFFPIAHLRPLTKAKIFISAAKLPVLQQDQPQPSRFTDWGSVQVNFYDNIV